VFKTSGPQGGAVGSDSWVDEVHPLECRRGFRRGGGSHRGFGEARRDSVRAPGESGRRGVGDRVEVKCYSVCIREP
jgi:hypothetical protein